MRTLSSAWAMRRSWLYAITRTLTVGAVESLATARVPGALGLLDGLGVPGMLILGVPSRRRRPAVRQDDAAVLRERRHRPAAHETVIDVDEHGAFELVLQLAIARERGVDAIAPRHEQQLVDVADERVSRRAAGDLGERRVEVRDLLP